MKKIHLHILLVPGLLFFLLTGVQGQYWEHKEEQEPKGKIRSFTGKRYSVSQGKYALNGKETSHYDEDKNCVEKLSYGIDSNVVNDVQTSSYKNGLLMEFKYVDQAGKLIYQAIPAYDSRGKIIEDSQTSRTVKFKYDTNGNLVEEGYYVPGSGKLFSLVKYKYDACGNQTEEERRSLTEDVVNKFSYEYDDKKNLIEETEDQNYKGRRLYKKRAYKYDDNNNRTEELITDDSLFYSRFTYLYDANNNIIEKRNYDSVGTLRSQVFYEYQYDAFGNWILKTIIDKDNAECCVFKREIVYY